MDGNSSGKLIQRDSEKIGNLYEQVDIGPVSYTHLDVYKRQQFNMGREYIKGKHVEKNYFQATEWLNKSAVQGNTISIPIRPVHYVKIHPRIRRMTQLGAEELADAPEFLEAMRQFVAWCGEDYALLTWGCDNVSVLKQNMDFFQCQEQLPPLCDIQKLYSDEMGCKDRKGLKAAMEELSIAPDESRSFHNALHDAYYTALVLSLIHICRPAPWST